MGTRQSTLASQAAWYRMENGPKSKNGKKLAKKIENGPRPEMGKNFPTNAEKMVLQFFRRFWAIFSPFRAEGHFLFFGQFFPIFGFRPVFHSIPGGLTRKSTQTFSAKSFFKSPSGYGRPRQTIWKPASKKVLSCSIRA